MAKQLSTASANLGVKALRACFGTATKHGLTTKNVAALVDRLKTHTESKRRPFTVPEIRKLLDTTGDSEWRGIILTALYTSARLGDIARLTWRNIALDSEKQETERKPAVAFVAHKTGKRMVVPMARPLADYFESLPSTDDPNAVVFPKAAEASKRIGTLSNQFYGLLVEAGLAEARTKKNTGKGRHSARPVGEISFHSLRA
jgi:integrase